MTTPKQIPPSEWKGVVGKYQGGDAIRSLWQLGSTLTLLVLSLVLMHWSLDRNSWLTMGLALPTAGLIIRTFIIMHDCAHGSFLPWPKVNDAVGFVTGVLTLTPFHQWRRDHALHHASSGDLDRRGYGDIATLTVEEYEARSAVGQFSYRLFRSPIVLLGLGPLQMIVLQRLKFKFDIATGSRQFINVWLTNIAIASLVALFVLTVGYKAVLLVYLPAYYLAAASGVWLFYVQHQFEEAYWAEHGEWDYATAAITGSSYLRLNPVLQWFTGNIGLHHVHHLGPRIPNYRLQQVHNENPVFNQAHQITLIEGVKALRLALWDEQARRMIPFKELRRQRVAR
ncbi:MAG: fatty acid desaturase [Gemmatimonadetes bacterium]|jgi:omega-6 fatty acid desaturase (delta-12 desaturase)|nr:fatty acid desaturase [Gemmatimonadota bacterium]